MFKISILILCFVCFATTTNSQNVNALRKRNFNLNKGIAIDGYDAVSYLTQKKAVKGNKNFSFNYGNAIYYFSSSENLEFFKKSPNSYEPQFGGWCAYAMGNTGEKVEVDPKTFKILNGKLYLFYNKYLTNTLKSWNKDEVNLKSKADKNWVKIFK